jgi:glycosyltransferase involved in cell wall biosynthesis
VKKKKLLITSFDMAIGGVERSLIGLLSYIDYRKYDVDLMLYKHEGELFSLIPKEPNLLQEIREYTTFRKSTKEILKEGNVSIGVTRLLAKYIGTLHGKRIKSEEPGYLVIQYGWKMTLPFLPVLEGEYDAAISFLWPHYFVGNKVRAKRKIGWIHTDYSNISINKALEDQMWNKMDRIVAVSEGCKDSFLNEFPSFGPKTEVLENMISPSFIKEQSNEDVTTEMPVSPGRTRLLTVGRFSYAKGIDDAIYACRKLLDLGCDIEWYVVGYGHLENEYKDLIHKLNVQDRFKLLGKKTNPYPYIKACDIYVQPSRYEGKAVTVREAQILGKPVLITNFPTAGSQVRDGIDGVIAPLGVDGLVNGINQLIADQALRKRLVANALATDYGNNSEIEKLYMLLEA